MAGKTIRGSALAVTLCAVALFCGCSSTTGRQDVSGSWKGTLALRFADGGEIAGVLNLTLDQGKLGASGLADWEPIGETQGIAGSVDGIELRLRLVFRCESSFETTLLAGRVSGDSITIDNATGSACRRNLRPRAVSGGSGSLTRTLDNVPL